LGDNVLKKDFDLNLLPIAVALYEERSVTLAARKLGMSQPALSEILGKLRKMVDDELFIKTGYGMVPTPRAHSLIAVARDSLTRLKQELLTGKTFNPATSKTTFTFALTEVQELVFFPKIIKALQLLAPHTHSCSVNPPAHEVLRGLENGEIDAAIGLFPELEKHRFFKQRLLVYGPVCLMRANHPFRDGSLSLKEYLGFGHVEVDPGPRTGSFWKQMFRQEKMSRRIVVTITRYACLPSILQESDLIATVSRPAAIYFSKEFKNLRFVSAPFRAAQIVIHQHWHAKYQHDPRSRWIRRVVADLYKEEGARYGPGSKP
jgi:DNA-binding transcriptional LysR family regulator